MSPRSLCDGRRAARPVLVGQGFKSGESLGNRPAAECRDRPGWAGEAGDDVDRNVRAGLEATGHRAGAGELTVQDDDGACRPTAPFGSLPECGTKVTRWPSNPR